VWWFRISLDRLPLFVNELLNRGWDQRRWTRAVFRIWWAAFSLERLAQRTRKPIVAGIVHRPSDLRWLAAQQVYAAVADMDFIASD
jgi:hypothetical protein